MRSPVVFISMLALLVTGCSANYNSIYRHKQVPDSATITFSDAKQRAILTQKRDPTIRMCLEPSPDVFSVFAQSLSAGGQFGQSGPKQIEAAASFALATAEQGATIQRTQTINLLKEVMYRTCERYLNGEIGSAELAIQAVRDQRMIISTLAIEQLTGVTAPGAVIIGARGGGAAGASSGTSVALIAAAQQRRTNADNEYKLLENTAPSCTEVAKLTAAELADAANAAKKKKKLECDDVADRRTAAAKDLAALEKAAGDGSVPVSVSSDLLGQFGTPLNNRADAQSVKEVTDAVWNIVEKNLDQDEFLLFCMRGFDQGRWSDAELRAACVVHVSTGIRTETLRSQADAKIYEAVLSRQFQQTNARFDPFWRAVVDQNNSGQADPAKLRAILGQYLKDNPSFYGRSLVQSMQAVVKQEDLLELFQGLTDDVQVDLGNIIIGGSS